MRQLVYKNDGNALVLDLVPKCARRILDVGCGAGDNAARLKGGRDDRWVVGLTHSPTEAEIARTHCNAVHVLDLRSAALSGFGEPFDTIVLSHVLEHLPDPVDVLRHLLLLLRPGGYVVIAVPNVLEWRTRLAFLNGRFEYADHGILDRTHLRFYTPRTAVAELVGPLKSLSVEVVRTRGAFPLGPFRHFLLWRGIKVAIDLAAVQRWPTLFASEVAFRARKLECLTT